MAQQQSSRLNRLLTLLDTGSTSVTRRSAAKQIGEIAKQHPAELQPLLKKVRQYLRSKSWDTRVAAAYALGAIAENVKHATLKDVLTNANAEMEKLGQAIDVEKSLTECLNVSSHSASSLTFSRFDVKKVLEFGALLLSSGGQEYDVGVDNAKNPAERLARQKQNLRRRLGLDVCEQFMDVNDVIRDEDLMISRTFSGGNGETFMHSLSYQLQGGRQEVQQLVANMVPGMVMSKTLSARERNMLKRKAKVSGPKEWAEDQDVEEPSAKRANTTAKPFVMEQSNTDKLVMESGLEEDQPDFIGDGQWPFARFVELLMHDMFDPVWEVRHGSIMALREILSSQAASAAVVVPDFSSIRTSDTNSKKNSGPQRDVGIDLNLDVKPDIKEEAMGNGVTCQRMQNDSSATAPMTELSLSIKQEHDIKDSNGTGLRHDKNDYSALPFPVNDACTSFANDSRALEIYLGAQHSWTANMEFLQDCTLRLLCVFALDRFGDYVSDQVVAPVRETCAQALGAVVKQMHPVLVHKTLSILLQMQNRAEWEVRHGSLLGIKYLVAVRQEMVEELLPCVLPTCMAGLEDADDDVRAVAAESLLPAARAIVSHAGHLVDTILLRLWDILLDLDDLSPSTSSVMHLLAEIYCQPKVVPQALGNKQSNERPFFDLNKAFVEDRYDSMDSVDNPFLLSNLAPRLWPFMRHNISSVRLAAIRTLERLLEAGNLGDHKKFWALPILGDMVRVVFQNLLMESNEEILECSRRVWRLLLQSAQENVATEVDLYFLSWLKLASTSSGSPLENSKMFSPNVLPRGSRFKAEAKLKAAGSNISGGNMLHSQKGTSERQKNIDNAFVPKVVVGADGEKTAIQMRVVTSSALGVLCATVPESTFGVIVNGLSELLASPSGIQRQVASLVLVSWFKELRLWPKEKQLQAATASKPIYARIQELLSMTDQLPTPNSLLPYAELARTYAKLRGDAGAFIKQAETVGCFKNLVATSLPLLEGMNAEAAIELTKTFTQEDTSEVGSAEDKQSWDTLESGRQRVLATAGYLQCIQVNLHSSVLASLAGAVVWMGELPTKLNPIIKPLMASLKREQEEVLQQSAAEALAEVIAQCVGRKPCPNERLIKNISTLICADPSETPIATSANASWFSFDDDAAGSMKPSTGPRAKAELGVGNDERAKIEGAITRRGAELALRSLCQKFEEHVFEKLPKLWGCITEAIKPASSDGLGSCVEEVSSVLQADGEPQPLINNLQLVRSIAPFLDKTLHSRVLSLLPAIFGCVRHNHAAVRFAAAKCITAMAKTLIEPVMIAVLSKGIPMLEDTSIEARQGGGMLVASLVDGLGLDLVPYAPLLIVPLLGCMSDSNHIVRQNIAHSFAALVPLLPLARGFPQPAGLQQFQASKNVEDSRFLEQLLDNRKVDDYKLSVELKTTLRRYQQEGINWLAFLKRFKLHGILCDDMGLGKTIQASAVLASDIAERAKDGSSSETTDRSPLQSLVVCPSTLVGHWVYEIEKFIPLDVLKPMQYVGSPQERLQLRDLFASHNLIITSYDVLRKDIDALSEIVWNYCILDEGHIIKSAKSKITLSVKRLQAEHRLILSGTPIQNNVLELWSLFDFLMPGFLGSERQFQATYGKPLLAARDPKCSAKEAEAGVLAMEALHKQVMPFLLRRTKEEVLSDLPPKIIQDRYCDLSPLQLRLYENFSRSQAKKEVASLVKAYGNLDTPDSRPISGGASTHVFQALQYLRKLCSHPLLVLNELHGQSASDILDSLSEENKTDLHDLQHAPKLLALREILEECGIGLQSVGTECGGTGQHRVLIFAQLKSFLDIIEKDLFHSHMKGVTYLRLDGSVDSDKRFDIVKTFNSDPTIDVLLLTTHVGGLGLNLTAADTVVFVEHDWNPMRDLQAMDRAHRLGQRRVVNVHRLIMRGTLEEKVMSLQRFKLSIAASVINAENASLHSMDTTQLLDLFTVSGAQKKAAKPSIEEGEDSTDPNGKGLKAMLSSLEELWDQSQYSEEYNLSQFVARLKG